MMLDELLGDLSPNPHVEGGPYPEKLLQQLVWFAEAIDKAVSNGYNGQLKEDEWHVHADTQGRAEFCLPRPTQGYVTHLDLFTIIYSHQFAACLWPGNEVVESIPDWQYHLAHMVNSNDPLAYIKEHGL